MQDSEKLLLEMNNICKSFPGVRALENVKLEVKMGEIHGLVGENGAGKSTLLKILAGVITKDSGVIKISGKEVDIRKPDQAFKEGIAIIHQELSLLPQLNIAENIFVGRLKKKPTFKFSVDWRKCYEESKKLLDTLELSIDPRTPIWQLKTAQQQMVEIAKALSLQAKIIAMDEPTSSLSRRETEDLFHIIKLLKIQKVGIIFVSHRLAELKEICEYATVLRDGKNVGTVEVKSTGIDTLINMMVGRDINKVFPKRKFEKTNSLSVEVRNVTNKKLEEVSFSARKGEIIGIAGLVGAGRTELARAIFGLDPINSGEIWVDGKKIMVRNPSEAISYKIGLLPEDRKTQGLVLTTSIKENITLASLRKISYLGVLNFSYEEKITKKFVQQLGIVTPSINRKVKFLSGGNQQKVVISKWLCSDASIYIMDEPTRGIDVGTKMEIYHLLSDLAANGSTIIMISSELPEILGMSDRVYVMNEGRIMACLERHEISEEQVMLYASGNAYRYLSPEFEGKKITVGFIPSSTNHERNILIEIGIEEYLKIWGGTLLTPPEEEVLSSSKINIAQSLIRRGAQALVIDVDHPNAFINFPSHFENNTVPIISIGSPIKGSVSTVTSFNKLSTKFLNSFIRDLVKKREKVLILKPTDASHEVVMRLEIIKGLLTSDGEIEVIVDSANSLKEPENINAQLVFLPEYKITMDALSILRNIEGCIKKPIIVGYGISSEILEAIKTGQLAGTITESLKEIGQAATETIFCVLEGKTPPTRIYTSTSLITKSNIDWFQKFEMERLLSNGDSR